jgi:O-antigen/teichoic acid export membrane protein
MTLGRNILWNFLAFICLSLLVIFVTPYMVRRLGLDAFGVYAIMTAINQYLTALDFGVGNAMIRFLATENERGDRNQLGHYLRSGLLIQALLGALLSLILFLVSGHLVHHWIQVPPGIQKDAVDAFRISSSAVFFGFMVVAYAAIPAALHRFDMLAFRTILFFSIQFLLIALVLYLGGHLRAVAIVYAGSMAGAAVYLVLVSKHLLPRTVLWPGWERRAVLQLLRFGRMKFPAQVSASFLQQFDRIALGALAPVNLVAYYVVPQRISQRLSQTSEQIASPFYPTISSHLVADRIPVLRYQYQQGMRVVLLAVSGAISVLGGLASPLLRVWMGDDFSRQGTVPFRLLLVAYGAGAVFTLPSVAADAAARPGIPAAFMVCGSLLHVALLMIAIPRWGLVGAAAAVLCGYLVPLLFGVPAVHRRIHALPPLTSTVMECRGALLAGLVTLVVAWGISRTDYAGSGIVPLFVSLTGASVLFVSLAYALGGIRNQELRQLVRIIRARPESISQ